MLGRLRTFAAGMFGESQEMPASRTVADVFGSFRRNVDPVAALAAATNPAEAAFYEQSDRSAVKWHHYLAIYDRYLARFRGTEVRFLEIGVNNGGSLQFWRRYFGPQAVIHGLDINPRCAAIDDLDLTIHIGSQDDVAVLAQIVDAMGGLDVVVDDGSHVWTHQIASFEALFPKLSERGIYLCEDTHTSYWPEFGRADPHGPSFVAYAKDLVDPLHAPYALDGSPAANDLARAAASISFHDSIVAIEKETRPLPFHTTVGRRTVA